MSYICIFQENHKLISLSRWKEKVLLFGVRFSIKMVEKGLQFSKTWFMFNNRIPTSFAHKRISWKREKKVRLNKWAIVFSFLRSSNRTFGNSPTKEKRVSNVWTRKISECPSKIVKYVFILFTPTKLRNLHPYDSVYHPLTEHW